MSHFGLCKYSDGAAALKRLDEIVFRTEADPQSFYQPYTEIAGTDSLGVPIKAGLPIATWTWPLLPQEDVDRLADYEGTVYLRTDTTEGLRRKFKLFTATMLILDRGEKIEAEDGEPTLAQRTGPVVASFISLEVVP